MVEVQVEPSDPPMFKHNQILKAKVGTKEKTTTLLASRCNSIEHSKEPTRTVGGVQYIATLKNPFPHIPLVASQGITIGAYNLLTHQKTTEVVANNPARPALKMTCFDPNTFSPVTQLTRLASFSKL
ncbi:hypothetical protein CTI12_AA545290 [Artemisia annua]|uniref:Uncharacterized protein n=1 Tax=Artemisia annua TaxID=35608 RepID=A0A2U1KZ89_ARTAN|nr:hypothetical protein CTI12_AA545290 [Artemisia annua]